MKDVKIVIVDGKVYEMIENNNFRCSNCIGRKNDSLCDKLNYVYNCKSGLYIELSDKTRVDLLELLNKK